MDDNEWNSTQPQIRTRDCCISRHPSRLIHCYLLNFYVRWTFLPKFISRHKPHDKNCADKSLKGLKIILPTSLSKSLLTISLTELQKKVLGYLFDQTCDVKRLIHLDFYSNSPSLCSLLLSLPHSFLSLHPHTPSSPPPSLLLPWRFITALTERPLPSPSEQWEGCISRISSSAVSFLQWARMQYLGWCMSMPVFQIVMATRHWTCLTFPSKRSFRQIYIKKKVAWSTSAVRLISKGIFSEAIQARSNNNQNRKVKNPWQTNSICDHLELFCTGAFKWVVWKLLWACLLPGELEMSVSQSKSISWCSVPETMAAVNCNFKNKPELLQKRVALKTGCYLLWGHYVLSLLHSHK